MSQRIAAAVFATLCITECFPAEADAIINVSPTSQTVGLGSTPSVELGVSGLGGFAPPALGAFDLTVTFDPTILQLTTETFGDPVLGDQLDLSGLGSIQLETPGTGSIELFELSLDSIADLDSLQPSSFVLFTLNFQALGPGTSPVSVQLNALSDAFGDSLAATANNASVQVSSVPEPGLLVPLGFAIMMTYKRIPMRFRLKCGTCYLYAVKSKLSRRSSGL